MQAIQLDPARRARRLRRRRPRRQPAAAMDLFFSHVHLHGGPAPVRRFLPELIELIWNRQIDPGKVFDLDTAARRSRRGLPGHGRAPRHQGPAAPSDHPPTLLTALEHRTEELTMNTTLDTTRGDNHRGLDQNRRRRHANSPCRPPSACAAAPVRPTPRSQQRWPQP